MPFMRGLRITGGNRLSGTIAAHGAKNAVLPILAAQRLKTALTSAMWR